MLMLNTAIIIFVALFMVIIVFSSLLSGLIIKFSIQVNSIFAYGLLIPVSILFFAYSIIFMNAVCMGIIIRLFPRSAFQIGNNPGEYNALKSNFKLYNLLHKVNFSLMRLLLPLMQGWLRITIYRLMGAKIGRNVNLSGILVEPDMIMIGNNVTIGHDVIISGHVIDEVRIVLDKIKIGDNSLIGARSIIAPGVVIGNSAVIAAGSFIPCGKKIPKGKKYFSLTNRITS